MASKEAMEQGKARRKEIVAFVRSFTKQNGYSPSVQEITEAVGLASGSTTRYHLELLAMEGRITMVPTINRSIRVVK